MPDGRHERPVPGDAMIHPLPLLAVGLLLLNDHVLKSAWPGALTGKLSDVAGLVYFPLVLTSAWELVQAATGRWRGPSVRPLAVAVVATIVGFALVKTTGTGADAFGWLLGAGQWAITSAGDLLAGRPLPALNPARVAADPTDLLALPAVLVALAVGWRRTALPPLLAARSGT